MRKTTRQQRDREKRKTAEAQVKRRKRRFRYAAIFVLIYLLSIAPYALDLLRHPNLWNAIVFLALDIGGTAGIILIAKHDR